MESVLVFCALGAFLYAELGCLIRASRRQYGFMSGAIFSRLTEARVSVVMLVLGFCAAFARLFLGVDFTDEAFYSSVPQSFVLGSVPYRDELAITQNFGIFLWPFYKLYHVLVGSTTGIVLFNRCLFLMLLCLCAAVAYRTGRRHSGVVVGRLLAAFTLGFSHFNIPSLSYNTIGGLSLFLGCVLLAAEAAPLVPKRCSSWSVGLAAMCFIVAAFVYPSLFIAALVGLVVASWLVWRVEGRWRGRAQYTLFTVAMFGFCLAVVFFFCVSVRGVVDSLTYVSANSYAPGDFAKRLFVEFPNQVRLYAWYLLSVLIPVLIMVRWCVAVSRWRGCDLIPSVVLYAGLWGSSVLIGSRVFPSNGMPVVAVLGFVFVVLCPWLFLAEVERRLFVVLALPSLCAAVFVGVSSTSGFLVVSLGLFPAAFGLLLLLVVMLQRQCGRLVVPLSWQAIVWVLCIHQSVALIEHTYRDQPFQQGIPVFSEGPYAGLLTSPARANFIHNLRTAFSKVYRPGGTLLAYDDIPAAYLFSDLRPHTFSTWIIWGKEEQGNRARLARIVQDEASLPDIILRTSGARSLHSLGLGADAYALAFIEPVEQYEFWMLKKDRPPIVLPTQ